MERGEEKGNKLWGRGRTLCSRRICIVWAHRIGKLSRVHQKDEAKDKGLGFEAVCAAYDVRQDQRNTFFDGHTLFLYQSVLDSTLRKQKQKQKQKHQRRVLQMALECFVLDGNLLVPTYYRVFEGFP